MRFIPSGTLRRHAEIHHMDMGQTCCSSRTFTVDILLHVHALSRAGAMLCIAVTTSCYSGYIFFTSTCSVFLVRYTLCDVRLMFLPLLKNKQNSRGRK